MPASDQIVTAKMVLQAQMELQRLGIDKTVAHLESIEPDLTEYFLEHSTALYHQILDTGATPRKVRALHEAVQNLILVCLRAQQLGYQALWLELMTSTSSKATKPPPTP